MQERRRRGVLENLIRAAVLFIVLTYIVIAITGPWAFHIGGRPTPLLYWSGAGKLTTPNGVYPIYLYFHHGGKFIRVRLDGLQSSGSLRGGGMICTAPGKIEQLQLTGTIFNAWSSTDNALFGFRLRETDRLHVTQSDWGYFNLYGRFSGPELVLDSRNSSAAKFRSGLTFDHSSVKLDPESSSDFKSACAGK